MSALPWWLALAGSVGIMVGSGVAIIRNARRHNVPAISIARTPDGKRWVIVPDEFYDLKPEPEADRRLPRPESHH